MLVKTYAAFPCPPGMFYAGYRKCLTLQSGPNPSACPLEITNPPPWGRPTCQGSGRWWWIHVGGSDTAWARRSNAKCLSSEPNPMPAGRNGPGCLSATSHCHCLAKLKAAGCLYSIGIIVNEMIIIVSVISHAVNNFLIA